MDELLAEFLTETAESLSALDDAVLKLEREPGDAGTLAVVFRLVHTIKGTCGFLSLPRLERVAHGAEELLGAVRDGKHTATPELITTVLADLDRIKHIVTVLRQTGREPEDEAAAIDAIPAAPESVATEAAPAMSAAPPTPPPPPPPPPPAAVTPPPDSPRAPRDGIRVDVVVLESLMTLVSELVLTRNQLMQLSRNEDDSRFAAPLQRLSHIVSDLQEGVMKTRMQPIRHAWSRLPRIVRELAADLGKPMTLVMQGQDTELDRQLVELIRDPLTHMVRNSADHGLEPPHVRAAAGKPAVGTITLNSYHEGGHIIVEVSDDGAGLPIKRIAERVLAQGLATAAELVAMTDQQVQRFIFHPGLSTATSVTALSGRGVGMDVVKSNIERVGGTVDVRSTVGKGTVFTIKIPLTLAIISALIVEAQGERFALPQLCVSELVRAERGGELGTGALVIERVDGTPVLRLRDHLLPLIHLKDILRLPEHPLEDGDDAVTIVVINVGRTTLGLIVDQVFDTEEIVVKPVSPLLRHIPMFSGNTILGDGSVIMILDPNGLVRSIGAAANAGERKVDEVSSEQFERTGDRRSMLLVRVAQQDSPMAVPLGLVARIESVALTAIERSGNRLVTCYRDKLMPLIELCGPSTPGQTHAQVLVFTDHGRSMGLVVDDIVDVVEEELVIELAGGRPGVLGTALVGGQVTDVMDAGHWLLQGWNDWFMDVGRTSNGEARNRLLVVEDNAFFRQLLLPTLSAAGFQVTAVESAIMALSLRDRDKVPLFDVIISDVEMPGMDGLSFAQVVRSGGRWAHVPMIALSGRFNPQDIERGQEAGFDEYVGKFNREGLMAALARQLGSKKRIAA